MAKIGNLQVESLHIVGGAVTAFATDTGGGFPQSVTAVNPNVKPVQVFWTVLLGYTSVVSGNASITFEVKRTRGPAILWTGTISDSGNTGGTIRYQTVAGSWLDMSPQANDVYGVYPITSSSNGGPPMPSMFASTTSISAIWVKR